MVQVSCVRGADIQVLNRAGDVSHGPAVSKAESGGGLALHLRTSPSLRAWADSPGLSLQDGLALGQHVSRLP